MATCKNCIHYLVCNLKGAGCRDENGVFGNETITMIQSVEVERNCEEYLPSDVAPVKHGEWISENFYTHCSACGKMAIYDKYGQEVESDYCPNCGARMDGGD